MNIALIIAGGRGDRMKTEIPKQFLTVNEKPVIIYALEAFEKHADIDAIAVVCIEGWADILTAYAKQYGITKLKHIIPGGENGQASIRNGVFELEKHYAQDDLVLVHDAIRPMVSQDIISDGIATATQYGSAVTVIPCQEAMLETPDGISSADAIPRSQLRRTQTPQTFPIGTLADAHREALKHGITNSIASCTLMVELGRPVYFSHGSEKNIKLTTPDDLDIFRALLAVGRREA